MADEKDQRCIFAPTQKDLSVNPLLDVSIGSLDFVPHLLCLYWSLNDFCTYRYNLLSDNDKAAIDKLEACDAAWVACHMGQQTYGLKKIESATDGFSFIVKSIFTWTKQMTPNEKIAFEPNGDDDQICQLYSKCACTNQEKIEEMLKTSVKSVKVMFYYYYYYYIVIIIRFIFRSLLFFFVSCLFFSFVFFIGCHCS